MVERLKLQWHSFIEAENFLARVRPPMDGEIAAGAKAQAALVAAEG